ncbi:hypothetical protein B6E66_13655 [Streptomyces maremycinicus]|nr:hypothetical protein B6E66_13655 [Streptomyces sp. B9173]
MSPQPTTAAPLTLTYDRPAARWTDALPIGNGRIGAMCFGGTGRDRLQINDDTCWSGSPATAQGTPLIRSGEGPHLLAEARSALDDEDIRRAEDTLRHLQHGHSQAYQPLIDLEFVQHEPDTVTRYRRSLDLATAVTTHSYRVGADLITQDAWVSAPAQALVVQRYATSTDAPGPANLPTARLSLHSPHPTARYEAAAGDTDAQQEKSALLRATVRMPSHVVPPHEDLTQPVRYDTTPGAAVTALVAARVLTDGTVTADGKSLLVTDATRIDVILGTESDYTGPLADPHGDLDRLEQALRTRLDKLADAARGPDGMAALKQQHEDDHARLFSRVALTLGSPQEAPAHSTPERLTRFAQGRPDPALAALAFQYGRYLLLASSRPGSLPANLQGIWNAKIRPPWSSNYTTNINVEMNYWPAEVTNLTECHQPLLDWLQAVRPRGEQVARELYGADGWILHHNSDAWGFAYPAGEGDADPCWSFWPLGAAWLSQHLWQHYDFTRDLDFLKKTGWPLLRDAALFCLDWLTERPDGTLGTAPSTSPENHYTAPDGLPAAVTTSTTSDLVLIREILTHGLDMLSVLAQHGITDPQWRARATVALGRLLGERVTCDGRLAEWATDHDEPEPTHRHTSHLIGVYPAGGITPDTTPELAAAAAATLDARGPKSTGWSLAWRLALRARLHDAAGAATLVHSFLAPMADDASEEPSMTAPSGVYGNLFCAHPPFQIDGNFGFTAGVAEMLVQSHASDAHTTVVHLLPALPEAWADGSFSGLRARGAVTVDAQWRDGQVTQVTLTSDHDRDVVLRFSGKQEELRLHAGVPRSIDV